MGNWNGVISAIITPMKEDGSAIDTGPVKDYCDFIIDKGVSGIFAMGTTGEGPLLSLEEKKIISKKIVDSVNGRTRVIIQSGCITTEETIQLTRYSKDIGADAAGILLPYYYNLDEEAIFEHFARVAEAVPDFPIFIYNIPQCTCNNLSVKLFERLINEIDTIAGIKTSNPDIFQIIGFVRAAKNKCSVFIGSDGLVLAGLSSGASGVVSGNASVFPEPLIDLYNAFNRGEREKCIEYQQLVDKMRTALGDGYYIDAYKKTLSILGIEVGKPRKPNRELTKEEFERLRKSLSELGFL